MPDVAQISAEVSDFVGLELAQGGVDMKQAYVLTFILEDRHQLLVRVFRKVGRRHTPDREITRATLNMEWIEDAGKGSGEAVRDALGVLLRGIRAIEPDLVAGLPAPSFLTEPPPAPEVSEEDLEMVRQTYREARARQALRDSRRPSTAQGGA